MGVSKNRGTPKSSILIGSSIINHPFWGYHYFWKHPYVKSFIRRHVEEHLSKNSFRRLQILHVSSACWSRELNQHEMGIQPPQSTAHPGDSSGDFTDVSRKDGWISDFVMLWKLLKNSDHLPIIGKKSCWKSTVCVLRQKPTKSLCHCVMKTNPNCFDQEGRWQESLFLMYQMEVTAISAWFVGRKQLGRGRRWKEMERG